MAINCKAIPITVLLLVVVLQLFLLLHTTESAAIGEHSSKTPTSGIRKIDLAQTKPKEGRTFASLEGGDDSTYSYPLIPYPIPYYPPPH